MTNSQRFEKCRRCTRIVSEPQVKNTQRFETSSEEVYTCLFNFLSFYLSIHTYMYICIHQYMYMYTCIYMATVAMFILTNKKHMRFWNLPVRMRMPESDRDTEKVRRSDASQFAGANGSSSKPTCRSIGHLKPSRPRLVPTRPNVCTSHVHEPLRFSKSYARHNLAPRSPL